MIDLSIVIVNWNTKRLLCDCIESIIEKTKINNYEIIVVDNASTDDSVGEVKQKFPDVKIIENNENVGFAKANNIGITMSKGEYICLSNTDIKLLNNALDRMYLFLKKNNNVGMVLPKLYDGNLEISRCCRNFPSLFNLFCEAVYIYKIFPFNVFLPGREKPYKFYKNLASVDTVPLCFTMIKHSAIQEVGLLDENYFF
jgi:hypothetical protein